LQIIGRGSRIAPGKSRFLILDFGNNVLRFGFWHAEREWKLNNDRKRKVRADREDIYPITTCTQCGALIPINCKTCEYCGYEFKKTEQEKRFVELQEMEYGNIIKKFEKGMSVQEMEEIRIAKNYKIGFLLHNFTKKQQFSEYAELKKYHPYWIKIQCERYGITE
jgi:ribosomal protein L40E